MQGNGENRSYGEFFEGVESGRGAFSFHVGGTVNEHLLIGGSLSGIGQTARDENATFKALRHANLMGEITYFPFMGGKGLYGRAGLGISSVSVEIADERLSNGGVGVMAGLGYMFWLGDSFNLGLGADFYAARLDPQEFDTEVSWYVPIQVNFMWY